MKGYCSKCFKVIDETEQLRGVCLDCRTESDRKVQYSFKHDGIITRRRKNVS